MEKEEQLLTIKEVAELLKLSVPTIRMWRFKKQIPCIKIGAAVRFRVRDIRRIMQEGLDLD